MVRNHLLPPPRSYLAGPCLRPSPATWLPLVPVQFSPGPRARCCSRVSGVIYSHPCWHRLPNSAESLGLEAPGPGGGQVPASSDPETSHRASLVSSEKGHLVLRPRGEAGAQPTDPPPQELTRLQKRPSSHILPLLAVQPWIFHSVH